MQLVASAPDRIGITIRASLDSCAVFSFLVIPASPRIFGSPLLSSPLYHHPGVPEFATCLIPGVFARICPFPFSARVHYLWNPWLYLFLSSLSPLLPWRLFVFCFFDCFFEPVYFFFQLYWLLLRLHVRFLGLLPRSELQGHALKANWVDTPSIFLCLLRCIAWDYCGSAGSGFVANERHCILNRNISV